MYNFYVKIFNAEGCEVYCEGCYTLEEVHECIANQVELLVGGDTIKIIEGE